MHKLHFAPCQPEATTLQASQHPNFTQTCSLVTTTPLADHKYCYKPQLSHRCPVSWHKGRLPQMAKSIHKTLAILLKGDITKNELLEDALLEAFELFTPRGQGAPSKAGTYAELFDYLTKSKVPPAKAVEKLISVLDVPKSEPVNDRELVRGLKSYIQTYAASSSYAADHQMHVVGGSNRLNQQSGTSAFKLKAVTAGSMRRLRAVFDELDSDRDGAFTLPEWRLYVQRTKPEHADMAPSIFRSLDTDRDGRVSFKQLIGRLYPTAGPDDIKALMALAQGRCKGNQVTDPALFKEMASIYEIYDDDHDGCLDEDEFLSAIQQAGYSEDEAHEVWGEADIDRSGHVSLDDFKVWYITHTAAKLQALQEDEEKEQ